METSLPGLPLGGSPVRELLLSMMSRKPICIYLMAAAVCTQPCSPAQPPPLEFSKWSGDINVPDPVAISFDDVGRAYVTQTRRRKANDLDIRANRDWIVHDLSFQHVEDKRRFYRERLAPGLDNSGRVKDLNGDGSSDIHDLTVLKEAVHRLEDTDGDGIADDTRLFHEGFHSAVGGIAAGILCHNGDVYVTAIPDVRKLTDRNGDGRSDFHRTIASDIGPHIAYAGHDMHGLTVGPDEKIYWSIGDKGITGGAHRGREFHFPNQGGVMRCNPDGSDFEVFAHGLRNIQELAFDQFGNLFGVDNDADKPSERERFVYIVKGMDAGWRCNYQYRGDSYNPWTEERLWHTQFDQQAAYIIPPITHSINGPAGFAFNPGTALSPDYHNYFFLTGAPNGQQIAFQVKPHGASFEMINQHEIGNSLPIVGISFAPDGALYGVDWGGGYPLNQKGAIWRLDAPGYRHSKQRRAVQALLADDMSKKKTDVLTTLLGHADQRIRLKAQFEFTRRRDIRSLTQIAQDTDSRQLGRIHAIWGLGRLADISNTQKQSAISRRCVDILAGLLNDDDREILCQVAKVLSDAPNCDGKHFVPLLDNKSERVRFFAMQALSAHPTETALDRLIFIAAAMEPSQTYLRHGISMAIESCADADQLAELSQHHASLVRLCAVVALRRSGAKQVAEFLSDADVAVAEEAARAIHDDFSIPDALPALAAVLPNPPHSSEIYLRRAVNACLRQGTADDFSRLIRFAFRADEPMQMRLEALDALTVWSKPPPLDRVTGRYREFSERTSTTPPDKSVSLLRQMLLDPKPEIQAAAMQVHKANQLVVDESMLKKLAISSNTAPNLAVQALNLLYAQNSPLLMDVLSQTPMNSSDAVRRRCFELMTKTKSPDTFRSMKAAYAGASTHLRQLITELMAELGSPDADTFLLVEADKAGQPATDTGLELLAALKSRSQSNSEIAARLNELNQALNQPATGSPEEAFTMCLHGGDAANGKKLFNTHLQAQCVRCHRVGNKGSTVGPKLQGIATKRNTSHLLRAVIAPNADIDPKYRSVIVLLATGKTLTGVKVRESGNELVIADSQGKEVVISTEDIDDVVEQNISIMPDMTKILSYREIRDLVAYLKSLK